MNLLPDFLIDENEFLLLIFIHILLGSPLAYKSLVSFLGIQRVLYSNFIVPKGLNSDFSCFFWFFSPNIDHRLFPFHDISYRRSLFGSFFQTITP